MDMPHHATVLGSGSMGPGIAALLARYGSRVRLNDVSEAALREAETACAGADKVLEQLGIQATTGGLVTFEPNQHRALEDSELVIEAVPEDLELKKKVLAQAEEIVDPSVIIATNTSGIPITDLASEMSSPERLIGMHWSNPPHLMPMIEVVKGRQTNDAVQERLIGIIKAFGYEAVVEREIAGFVENRILYAIMRECLSLAEQGIASHQDIDTCVKWGIGYKLSVVGPMRLLDMAGLDIYQAVAGYLNPDLSNETGVSRLVTGLTEADNFGMKSGQGLYDYEEGEVAAKRADIVQGLIAARRTLAQNNPV